ncbi:RUN and FYVE domain-containing protein 4 [Microcaecilia unicolor]|uniref:RUN and FYVE domain-containing protein 4 n=1 Tax=Microcaecilia unicolor TaxID=1415580 RepID=A0A6P7YMJ8_9AMPH|nr:RUN and FYVE domain-containing protein 4 [Microcaecilia unicolor]
MAGDGELSPVIKDLKNTIAELHREYKDKSLPVTDGSPQLHRLCARLEQLLQFDQKEKRSLTGYRKDYWDFLCHILSKMKGGHEGITFVSSQPQLKTPIGKGRSFIRYCLVHQQLAEALQICFMETKKVSEWYYSRNPFLKEDLHLAIFNHLYELNGVTFNLALKRTDLDSAWPMGTGDLYKQSKQNLLNHEGENKNSEVEPLNTDVVLNKKTTAIQEEKPSACGPSEQQDARNQKSCVEASGTEVTVVRDYEAKICFLENQNTELMEKLKKVSRKRATGSTEDFQKVSNLLDSLAASEKREIETRRMNLDLQTQIDKLTLDLQSSLRAEQMLSTSLGRHKQNYAEERDRLQRELESAQGRYDEQLRVQSEQISELLETNKFLRKTLEELDVLVNELRQHLASKEEEISQLTENHAEEKVYLAEVHAKKLSEADGQQGDNLARFEKEQQATMEELNEVKAKLEFKDLELNEMISEHQVTIRESAGLAKSLQELEERFGLQEVERKKCLLESETYQLQSQELQAQCQMLRQQLREREDKAEEKDRSIMSLQLEVSMLQASEKHWKEQSWGSLLSADGKEAEPWEEKKILEERIRLIQLQNGKIAQKLANSLLEKETLDEKNNTLSESLESREQSLQSVELELRDLNKQLLVCQEQTGSLKNALAQKEQTLQDKEKDIRALKKEVEDTSVKLRKALSEKSVMDTKLAEIMATTVTLANEKSQASAERLKLEETLCEVKRRLSASEEQRQKTEDEVHRALQEEEHLRQVLQQISGEKETLAGERQTTVAELKGKTQEIAKLGHELEQLQTSMKNETMALSEQLAIIQSERDALFQQKKELEYANLAQSEERVQLKYQMKNLELEKLRAEQTSTELEVTREQLSTSQSEKEALEKKLAKVMMELSQKAENSHSTELENLRKAKEDQDLRMKNLEEEKQMLQSRLQTAEMQLMDLAGLEEKQQKVAEKLKEKLNDQLEKVKAESQSKGQILTAKESEMTELVEELKRAKLDCEHCRNLLEKTELEAKEREGKYLERITEQNDLITSLKSRVLDLVREKDAMWKKTEGIESLQRNPASHDPSQCVSCGKDFKPFTRKLQCRLCRNTMCQACSVKSGKKELCCIPCYQKGTLQVT